jgi:hypothetical protein
MVKLFGCHSRQQCIELMVPADPSVFVFYGQLPIDRPIVEAADNLHTVGRLQSHGAANPTINGRQVMSQRRVSEAEQDSAQELHERSLTAAWRPMKNL